MPLCKAREKAEREGRVDELDLNNLSREEAWEAMEEVLETFMNNHIDKATERDNS